MQTTTVNVVDEENEKQRPDLTPRIWKEHPQGINDTESLPVICARPQGKDSSKNLAQVREERPTDPQVQL